MTDPRTPAPPAKLDYQTAATAFCTENRNIKKKMAAELMGSLRFLPGTSMADKIVRTNTLLAVAEAVQPRDMMEAQLITQMISAHNMASDLLARANEPSQSSGHRDINMKYAEKFMRVYTEQMRALEKYRSRHARQVVVEQVRVESGGQAIVGMVHSSADKTA